MKVWFSNLLASLFYFPSPSLLLLSLPSSVSQILPCPGGFATLYVTAMCCTRHLARWLVLPKSSQYWPACCYMHMGSHCCHACNISKYCHYLVDENPLFAEEKYFSVF